MDYVAFRLNSLAQRTACLYKYKALAAKVKDPSVVARVQAHIEACEEDIELQEWFLF